MTDIGYRCARGEECPDYREGYSHARGACFAAPEDLAKNHIPGCDGVLEHYIRSTGRLECACGAAGAPGD